MTEALSAAVAILARREHGAMELAEKLFKKGFAADEVTQAITKCQNLNLQSDQRYVASLLRVRIGQGYGPERIRQECHFKKIDAVYYEQALETEGVDWLVCAQRVLDKKYKSCQPLTQLMQQKQKQFLRYRGFSSQLIAELFKMNEEMRS